MSGAAFDVTSKSDTQRLNARYILLSHTEYLADSVIAISFSIR